MSTTNLNNLSTEQPKKVAAVFGATGAVGQCILSELIAAPEVDKVISFVRKPTFKNINPKHQEIILTENIQNDLNQHLPKDTSVVFSGVATTIKQAGSQDAFYAVDYTLNYKIAEYAKQHNVGQYYLVSSTGASADSSIFYLRTKGQLDDAIQKLQFPRSVIYRPGILIRHGKRPDEPTRWNEVFMDWIVTPLWCFTFGIFGKSMPIKVEDVGRAMVKDYIHHHNAHLINNPPQHIIMEGSLEIFKQAQHYDDLDSKKSI